MSALDLLHISLADQSLYGFANGRLQLRFAVSTALNGAGERNGSGCTPRGLHQVRAKIGEGLPVLRCCVVGATPVKSGAQTYMCSSPVETGFLRASSG